MKNKAFTLVEVMITLLIFTLMLGSIYSTFLVGQRSSANFTDVVSQRQQARLALIAMVNELREARDVFTVRDDEAQTVSISFERPGTGLVSYTWTGKGEDANKLIRKNYTHVRTLASGIGALDFTVPTNEKVLVEVTAGTPTGKHFTLKQEVVLRAKTNLFMQGENEKIKQ